MISRDDIDESIMQEELGDASILLQIKENWYSFLEILGEIEREEKINPLLMDEILITKRQNVNCFEYSKIA